MASKPVVYQLVVRLFGNTNETRALDGTKDQNGCGRFADVDSRVLASLRGLGVTHLWLTGVLRQATLTDYTALGMPADDPDVVKGRAGSFYAVRDYYDVCPDYALEPASRMAELEALIRRVHEHDLRVLIDLVPNHVARGYGSVVHPERDLGAPDDQSVFFARDNAFFYLVDPPGRALRLSKPEGWTPSGVTFDGAFEREDGGPARTPRATGNNGTSPEPASTDWYETVKLNWGHHFVDPASSSYDPIPRTWRAFDEIVEYWQQKGVDGFRVDFAHWIPVQAWRWLIARAKARAPAVFFAEAYEALPELLEAGFDAVYHDEAYDTLKRIYMGHASTGDLETLLRSIGDRGAGYLHYLENHDEKRIAAPVAVGAPDESGFGSAEAARQLAPVLYLCGAGPVLLYNGQEVGERGEERLGFGGGHGRTSIFDYGSMPAMVRWLDDGTFAGGRSTEAEKALRRYYADLLALCRAPEIEGSGFWALSYFNPSWGTAGKMLAYARFAPGGATLVVVAANFAPGAALDERVLLPPDLLREAGVPAGPMRVVQLLERNGGTHRLVGVTDRASLTTTGFACELPNQTAHVYRVEAVPS